MDCDYDPGTSVQKAMIENSKRKGKKKKKSKFAEAISMPKPKFDPADKNYEKYFDEYYKLDCEDIIGDIPCRFKYREVVPNDFGLTVEEVCRFFYFFGRIYKYTKIFQILLAKEKELNKWCSLKKTIQIRPENVERYEQIAYRKKGQNLQLKQKILPSIFTPDPDDTPVTNNLSSNHGEITTEPQDGKNKSQVNTEQPLTKKKGKHTQPATNISSSNRIDTTTEPHIIKNNTPENTEQPKTNKKKGKHIQDKLGKKEITSTADEQQIKDSETEVMKGSELNSVNSKDNPNKSSVLNKKRKKKNMKSNNKTEKIRTDMEKISSGKRTDAPVSSKKRKRKQGDQQKNENQIPKKRFKNESKEQNPLTAISDARLLAYGIKPKKFKNKLKYKK